MLPLLVSLLLAPPAPPDPLSGPAVEVEAAPDTLVRRDFEGRLEPLDEEPGLAALRLLGLDAGRMARVEAIVVDRQRQFDRTALANYATVAEIGALLPMRARSRGETVADPEERRQRARLAALLGELSREFRDLEARGTLLAECGPILTPTELATATRLVEERAKAETDALAAANPETPRPELATRLRLEEFGRRVRGAIERFAATATAELERFRADLDLTPEQVESMRSVFGPIAVARLDRDEGDPEVRAEATRAFATFYRTLDRDQRAKLAAMRFREAMEREKARDAAATQPPEAAAATH
jgi:hypothetical protein